MVRMDTRFDGAERRIPGSLDELRGPADGVVVLPERIAWSGSASFDVSDPRRRLTLYRRLLDCGQLEDVISYMNAHLLLTEWSRIRLLTSRRLIEIWERRLPELSAGW